MPSKRPSSTSTSAAPSRPTPSSTTTTPSSSRPTPSSKPTAAAAASSPPEIVADLWRHYERATPQRVKLLDAFMAFLVLVGGLQFAYCVLVGNYPFNAFLAGFSATVGQFVLTASLRIQTNPENASEFKSLSHERAFADFVLGSLILHFFCVNFIN